jgi:flavin reductase (DIM6/NTAB) family NADH-FMN oxidoreductase RutF
VKKPWNIINLPVYSLATYQGNTVNMNICTYVSAVSLAPKQFMVAVYHQSKSLENITNSKRAILQLLHKSHIRQVNTLGKKSGAKYDKDRYLRKYNHLQYWKGYEVLRNASALILVEKQWSRITGDHTLFLFNVVASQTFNHEILTLDDLREKKLIRI